MGVFLRAGVLTVCDRLFWEMRARERDPTFTTDLQGKEYTNSYNHQTPQREGEARLMSVCVLFLSFGGW